MRMYDLIMKKRNGGVLTRPEIDTLIGGYVAGEIPDYQMSAFLMAVYFRGMSEDETYHMTAAVARSGDVVDLSGIGGVKADKHSTGGVGDKTTLVVAPIVAACGVKVAKMSGRGLGHTGGTVDKLSAIPGMRTVLSREEFEGVVNRTGLSVIGQSGNLAPADKKLYALRDVTATVDSIPLIAVSIMSKKLASGSDCILLDVKTGSGAFMKTEDDAIALAREMVSIGERAGMRTAALITDMDRPLGRMVGNSLEVIEAVEILKGSGDADLREVCLSLAAGMLHLAGKGSRSECERLARQALGSGAALARFAAMVEAQGGDVSVIEDTGRFAKAPCTCAVPAPADGIITRMDTERIGMVSGGLGAGRRTVEDTIDVCAGIEILHRTGQRVVKGRPMAILHTSREETLQEAARMYTSAVTIGDKQPGRRPLIRARVTKEQVEKF